MKIQCANILSESSWYTLEQHLMSGYDLSNGVNNIILNYTNGQVIVRILMLLNWCRTLLNRRVKARIEGHNMN